MSTSKTDQNADREEPPIVVGLGELLWDCFADERHPGGAPANVAFMSRQLGLRGTVCSRVGRDALGDELLEFLRRHRLDTDYVQRDADHKTGWVTVDLTRPQHPEYTIHEDVAWDYLAFDEPTRGLASQAAAICFGTLAQRSDASRETIYACLDAAPADCLRVYDVNLRRPWYERRHVERSLHRANLVKLSEEEVVALTEMLDLGMDDPHFFANTIRQAYEVDLVCVTRGARGCLLVDGEGFSDRPGIPIEAADPVGAGDALTAALIYAQLRGWPREPSAEFANRVAALVASRPGAMPELGGELETIIDECG
jgi:fructokinase